MHDLDFEIKINKKQRLAYIPKSIFAILGPVARATPDRVAVLLCNNKTTIDDLLTSLDIIKADLLHAKELHKAEESPKILPETQ